MDTVTLPLELERFATEAVAAGRYRTVSDVVAAGVSLLQRQQQARADLLASALAAEEEAERDGCVSGEEMLARVRARFGGEAWRCRVRQKISSPGLRDIDQAVDDIAANSLPRPSPINSRSPLRTLPNGWPAPAAGTPAAWAVAWSVPSGR